MTAPEGQSISTSRAVILVEGPSDRAAVETLAVRRGHDLNRLGVDVLAIGGATNLRPFLDTYGPDGQGSRLAGLGDIGEIAVYGQALARAGIAPGTTREEMEAVGFFMCVVDLEDELIRALGIQRAGSVVERRNTPGSFLSYQRQPAHREEPIEVQLRGFVTNWKIQYARLFVTELEPSEVPRPLQAVLDHVLG